MENTDQIDGTSMEIKDPAAVLAALERAKADAKKFRLEKESLEKELAEKVTVSTSIQKQYMNEKINNHIAKLGIQNGDRLLKYIKSDNLTLNEEFEVVGLDEQIETLKSDFPELFDPKLLVGGKADSAGSQPVTKILSASEMQAKMVLGR
jgi:hypothetical protein